MSYFTRRQLLLAGLGSGMVATGLGRHWQLEAAQRRQAELEALARAKQAASVDPRAQLQAWFGEEEAHIRDGIPPLAEGVDLVSPKIPYNRKLSKLLVRCCSLTTQQYLLGKLDPNYDGAIAGLPAYNQDLQGYRQVAFLRGEEDDEVEETVEVTVPPDIEHPIEQDLQQTEERLHREMREVVTFKKRIPVYFGFVLTSPQRHIIAFRGTSRLAEWVSNVMVVQTPYPQANLGQVHSGFLQLYQTLAPQLHAALQSLDPKRPCYVTGHSLGGALATLAALDVFFELPQFKKSLDLYTYASPRVGDPTFARSHSERIPNAYRIVNLGDGVPLVPPLNLQGQQYAHVGQEWSFLVNVGDLEYNHRIQSYRAAIERNVETNRDRQFPVNAL